MLIKLVNIYETKVEIDTKKIDLSKQIPGATIEALAIELAIKKLAREPNKHETTIFCQHAFTPNDEPDTVTINI